MHPFGIKTMANGSQDRVRRCRGRGPGRGEPRGFRGVLPGWVEVNSTQLPPTFELLTPASGFGRVFLSASPRIRYPDPHPHHQRTCPMNPAYALSDVASVFSPRSSSTRN
jgi:hypothetical protein